MNESKKDYLDLIPKRVLVSFMLVLIGIITGTNFVTLSVSRDVFTEEQEAHNLEKLVQDVINQREQEAREIALRNSIFSRLDSHDTAIRRMEIKQDSGFFSLSRGFRSVQEQLTEIKSSLP